MSGERRVSQASPSARVPTTVTSNRAAPLRPSIDAMSSASVRLSSTSSTTTGRSDPVESSSTARTLGGPILPYPGLPGRDPHPQRRDAAQERRAEPGDGRRRFDPGEALGQPGEDRLRLQPGEGGAEAMVDAPAEAEWHLALACDVESLGVGEALGVAVGAADERDDDRAGVD